MEYDNLSILIPAYNEETGIQNVLEELVSDQELQKAEIIVVDDGSTDHTAAIVRQFPRIKLIEHIKNKGYGSAIKTGTRISSKEIIIWFDSDGQHRVADLKNIYQEIISNDLDYCVGIRGKDSFQDPSRKLGKQILKWVVEFAVDQSIADYNSGLRGFKKEILLKYIHLLPKRFGASTLTTLLMIEQDHFGKEIPILVKERIGKSTVHQFRDGFQTIRIIFHIFLLFKPLRFFGSIGLLCILLGGFYGLYKAFTLGLGFPVLSSILISFGMQSIFFGLLCDQISALRREKFD